MPRFPFSFVPLRQRLYSREELFGGFDTTDLQSYAATSDFAIYRDYVVSGKYAPSEYFVTMMQALHDNAITQALAEYFRGIEAKVVGVMGGYNLPRNCEPYRNVVYLSRELTARQFTMISGGGPGAMEATHLGALLAAADDGEVQKALRLLEQHAKMPDLTQIVGADGAPNKDVVAAAHAWFRPAFEIAVATCEPGASVAIPTWLYGHEPTSPFATSIAKYFENSIREDGLLAVATHGVIYVEGRAGTLQEIFQDAAQNYYRTFGAFSPMVFLGSEYWTKTIPAVAVLQSLFAPDDFAKYVLVTDDVAAAADFVQSKGGAETAAMRITKYLTHETRRRDDSGRGLSSS